MMAGGAFFDIHVEGVGSHGARPETSIDPVLVASHITTALQAIVSRNVDAARHRGGERDRRSRRGDAYNVIPQTAGPARHGAHLPQRDDDAGRREHEAHRARRRGGVRRDRAGRFPPAVRAAGERRGSDRAFADVAAAIGRRGERRARAQPDHGVGGFLLHAGSSGPAPTSTSATATRSAARRCTIRATISTTRSCRSAPRRSPGWWRRSCRGSWGKSLPGSGEGGERECEPGGVTAAPTPPVRALRAHPLPSGEG